jgi:phenylpropionate dioxygenase-like ring-hydroxylating dioxygenase large terminal subunit
MTILTDQFFDSFATSVKDTNEAESLPPACYTDLEFFEFEKDALFYREWLCVGREEWLEKPGDYFTTTHSNEPIVVARNRDGVIHAMSSVCQHRAMLVAEGHGNTRAFVCPYHHWTYDLDGKLVGAPAMNTTCNFDKSKLGLPKLRVESWHGFIFVNFDPEAASLVSQVTGLEDVIANYDFASLRGPRPEKPTFYPWNWKVMFENNNDGYHANRLHAGPLHNSVPSSEAIFPELPPSSAGYYRLNGSLHADFSFNATLKAVFPIIEGLTDEDRNRLLFVNLPPSLSLVIMSDMVLYLILDAQSADTIEMTMGVLLHPDAMKDPLFSHKMKLNDDGVSEIVAQDLHVDELVQKGLKSRYAPRGRYSWQEGAQRQLNLWLVERYWAEWHRKRGPSAPVAKLKLQS